MKQITKYMESRISGYSPDQWVDNKDLVLVIYRHETNESIEFVEHYEDNQPTFPDVELNGDDWEIIDRSERPTASLASDTTTLMNDGTDAATLSIGLSDGEAVTGGTRDVVLSVDGDPIGLSLAPGESTTETLTTTKTSGSVIDCEVTGANVYASDIVTIEVTQ